MVQANPARKLSWRSCVSYPVIIIVLVIVLIILLSAGVFSITGIWNTILLRPMLNLLILMSHYFLGSFGIAILVLTIIMRLLMLPFTLRQLRWGRAMQNLRPEIKELQAKYSTDQRQQSQELSALYKKVGVQPLGCLYLFLFQWPIWLALYQSIWQALAPTPDNLVGLSKQLYSLSLLQGTLPLNHHFLWLDLTKGNYFMAILVFTSTWVLQKMASPPDAKVQQQLLSRVMLWGLPLLFGFMSLGLPSGLSLFWFFSNIFGGIIQYRFTGWGTLRLPSKAFLRGGNPQVGSDHSTKRRGTAGIIQKVGKSATPTLGGAKAANANSEKNQSNADDISHLEKKAGYTEPPDDRKS